MPLILNFDLPPIIGQQEENKAFVYAFTIDQSYLKPNAKSTDRLICKIGLAQEAHTLHRLDNYLTSFPDTPSFLAFIYCRNDLKDKKQSPAARLERAIHTRLRKYELKLKRYGRTRGGLEWFDVPISVLKEAFVFEYWRHHHKFGPNVSSSGSGDRVPDARKLVFWSINDREIERTINGSKQMFLVRPIEQAGEYRESVQVKSMVYRMTKTQDDLEDREIRYTPLAADDPLAIELLQKFKSKMTIQQKLDAEEIL